MSDTTSGPVRPIRLVPMDELLRTTGVVELAGGVVLTVVCLATRGAGEGPWTLVVVGGASGALNGAALWFLLWRARSAPGLPAGAVVEPQAAARRLALQRTLPLLAAFAVLAASSHRPLLLAAFTLGTAIGTLTVAQRLPALQRRTGVTFLREVTWVSRTRAFLCIDGDDRPAGRLTP